MPGSSVPQPTFGPLGFQIPASSAILAGVQTDMAAAFGGNLNPGLTTPQGQLASSQAAIINDANSTFLWITNQFDPALSSGRWQDGLAYIYFLTRNPAEATVVTAQLTGATTGTVVIPQGALAQAVDGNIYSSTGTVTINTSGTATVGFVCNTTGPIACPANTLTRIYQAIPGWDTVNNSGSGTTGVNTESAQAFEARRAASVALNSMGPAPAVQAAVLATPGVLDAYTYDNSSASPVTIQGQTIAANSLYCCVSGGTNAAVAQAIWTRKAPGCAYTGSTSVTVYDENSGYVSPYPSYTVSFQRPTSLPFFFAVSIKSGPGVPSNALTLIQGAINATFTGVENDSNFQSVETRARIGGTVYASDYYTNIALLGPWAKIVSIQIGTTNVTGAVITSSTISGTTLTVGSTSSGSVAIGQALFGTHVAAGTQIVSGSGSSWVVNLSQTAASGTIDCVAMSLNDVTVQINQEPSFTEPNAFLTLV